MTSHNREMNDPVSDSHQKVTYVLAALIFLVASAIGFAVLIEWQRYEAIVGWETAHLTIWVKLLVVWLLVAKSLVLFLPLLAVTAVLIRLECRRTAILFLLGSWTATVFWFTADLISVGFAGNHVADYLPYLLDAAKAPHNKVWQWAGEDLPYEVLLALITAAASGILLFFAAKWISLRIVSEFERFRSGGPSIAMTLILVLAVLSVGPALAYVGEEDVFTRIYSTLPFGGGVVESCRHASHKVATVILDREFLLDTKGTLTHSSENGVATLGHTIYLKNRLDCDMNLQGWKLETPSGKTLRLKGTIKTGCDLAVQLPPELEAWGELTLTLTDPRGGRQEYTISNAGDDDKPGLVFQVTDSSGRNGSSDSEEVALEKAQSLMLDATEPAPADPGAAVNGRDLPNILVVIVESFRHAAVSPELMSRLDKWADRGLRLQRHYSGSNCSHLGLFSLLYGRTALGFDRTLDSGVPPQMLVSLRRSGYRLLFVTAGEIKGFRRMDQFMGSPPFDEVVSAGDIQPDSMKDWPASDRRKLALVTKTLNSASRTPLFIMVYLMSSHFSYAFPPEFHIFKHSRSTLHFMSPRDDMLKQSSARYKNSVLFLENELMKVVQSIDPERNLIVITGDHGESLGEDGVAVHGSRMSEIQLRTPFVMVGPGISAHKVKTATSHADVLPTLLHGLAGQPVRVARSQGRDLLEQSALTDEVAITWPRWPEPDGLLIIRDNLRWLFKQRPNVDRKQDRAMMLLGPVDEIGRHKLVLGDCRRAGHTPVDARVSASLPVKEGSELRR